VEASAWALDTINGSPFYRKVSKAIDEIKINGSPIKNGRKKKFMRQELTYLLSQRPSRI
jgi:hypothetical protein